MTNTDKSLGVYGGLITIKIMLYAENLQLFIRKLQLLPLLLF